MKRGPRYNNDIRIAWERLTIEEGESLILNDAGNRKTCRLIFCLRGKLLATWPEGKIEVSAGSCGFIWNPRGCDCMISPSVGGVRVMEIRFPPDTLPGYIGRDKLERAFRGAEDRGSILAEVIGTTPSMTHLFGFMGDKADPKGPDVLLIIAKAVEIIWLIARRFDQEGRRKRLEGPDLRAVHKAQAMLEKGLDDPPSLGELSNAVGMSLSKFKQVFPRVSGLSPYAYLRQVRMEKALHLLRSTDISVIEASLEVGYSSPSRFSKAFAKRFGFKPSEARRME